MTLVAAVFLSLSRLSSSFPAELAGAGKPSKQIVCGTQQTEAPGRSFHLHDLGQMSMS